MAISDQATSKLATAEAKDSDDEDDDDDNGFDMASYLKVGQYVRACVVSTGDDEARRRIELSLRPEDTNAGLTPHDVVSNCTLMASIVSVEDHGCIMDIGLKKLKGFLPRKNIDSSVDEEQLHPGTSLLCLAAKTSGKVVQLTTLSDKMGNEKKVPGDATTINTFLPGTAVDVLVTETSARGLAGKVLGSLDATADLVHSGAGPNHVDVETKYKVGSRIKARVVCNFPGNEPKIGVSLLPHVLSLKKQLESGYDPVSKLPLSSTVEKCTVESVENDRGLFVKLDGISVPGFVHISRIQDGKIDALFQTSGPYQIGSEHRGRIMGYNAFDGMFYVSFEQSVLKQQFLRLEDVKVAEVVTGVVEKMVIDKDGVSGMVLKIDEGITGYVVNKHFADVPLKHPEKKFREGAKVKCRVLSVDTAKRRMRLTLKKTLVNSDAPVWKDFEDVTVGVQAPGTIISLKPIGAMVQFYGSLRGFLPTSQMSEAYIKDPEDHFKLGQVISVHALEVDPDSNRLVVSCRDPSAFGLEKQAAFRKLEIGEILSAKITEKAEDSVIVELPGELRAILHVGHLGDRSMAKNKSALKKLRVGQQLSDLMVLSKNESRRLITLTQKASLITAQEEGNLPSKIEEAKRGAVVVGFVKNIAPAGVLIGFADTLFGFLPVSRLPKDVQEQQDWGMEGFKTVEVKVNFVDAEKKKLMLVLPDTEVPVKEKKAPESGQIDDLTFGQSAEARVVSVKETQLNVEIGEVQGRVDISSVYDSFDDIKKPRKPLARFRAGQNLAVRVIGRHDARDHRFLPLSHRSKNTVLELTARPSDIAAESVEPLSLERIKVGDVFPAFVNNVQGQFIWVNLSPAVRGSIAVKEASEDLLKLVNPHQGFPVGSALKVRVLAVDTANNRLNLSARWSDSNTSSPTAWEDLKPNMTLPGRVTKVNERQVMVKISDAISGPVHLPDMEDDYDEANTTKHAKFDVIRVSVVEMDKSNKRLRLSTRPSRILSSTSPVKDREITELSQVKVGDVIRGFVKNVAEQGLFVLLGGSVTALVKIGNLSDRFVKDWKDEFQIDQLVKGRIIALDVGTGQVEMTLKASVVDGDFVPKKTLADFKKGQVVTGKIRKVEEYGAFIVVDDSANVSGLCHRSEMADDKVEDARKLYSEGDVVKAMVLFADEKKRRISFALKPSLFEDESESEAEDLEMGDGSDSDSDADAGGALLTLDDSDSDEDIMDAVEDEEMADADVGDAEPGGKYDWTADAFENKKAVEQDTAEEAPKKRKTGEIEVDRTADLDVNGPQTSSDYERLLLGQPDSSSLWIAYMAFQMQVSELSAAREIAERAIKTINIREQTEKLNVWVAYLNLEVMYGTESSTEEVFSRACQYNDDQEVHERLASIYIQSGKHEVCIPLVTREPC